MNFFISLSWYFFSNTFFWFFSFYFFQELLWHGPDIYSQICFLIYHAPILRRWHCFFFFFLKISELKNVSISSSTKLFRYSSIAFFCLTLIKSPRFIIIKFITFMTCFIKNPRCFIKFWTPFFLHLYYLLLVDAD